MVTLEGKTAVITGAASGIGARTARVMADRGASVVLADVTVDAGEDVAREVREGGGIAVFTETDVTQSDEVEAMMETAVDEFGSLDVLFNNAGIEGQVSKIVDYEERRFDDVVRVNFKGVWLGLKYGVRRMLEDGGGSIINTASIGGMTGQPQFSPYTGTKGAVIQMTRTVALEYARENVRVNAIAPGVVKTPMVERAMEEDPDLREQYQAMEPMAGMTDPADIANAAVFLASDLSSRITGITLPVDGGFTAG